MRLEIFILGITAFFIYNAYHDGKYMKMLLSFKKYYKMIFYAVLGVSIYLLLKRNPQQGKKLLYYANNMMKQVPIDRSTMDMMSPIFDFTSSSSPSSGFGGGGGGRSLGFMEGLNGMDAEDPLNFFSQSSSAESRILNSGRPHHMNPSGGDGQRRPVKRSVSETKKKYVASIQDWKCGECQKQLNAWFEVDHKIRLEYGGGNDVSNLIALCRECHGKKTAMENM